MAQSGGLPQCLSSKEPAFNAGDLCSISGVGRSPGGRHGNLLRYSGLENPMDRGDWWAVVHGVTKSQTGLKRLSPAHRWTEGSTDLVLVLMRQQ